MLDLSSGPKKAVAFSALAALMVAAATIADLIFEFPFAHMVGFDIFFFLGAVNVMYLAYDTWRDLVPRRRLNLKHAKGGKLAKEHKSLEVALPTGNASRGSDESRFTSAEARLSAAPPRGMLKPRRRDSGMAVPGSSRF